MRDTENSIEQPQDLDHVGAFLNIRVGDIQTVYRDWTDLIEVGQAIGS